MRDNEILKTAFKRYFDELHPYCPDAESEIVWNFTEEYRFEQKMDKLISSQKKSYWKYVNTIGKKVAIILVILSVMFSTAMSVNAFREPVVEFIVKTYERFSSFFIDEDSAVESNEVLTDTIVTKMSPQTIPDDFLAAKNYSNDVMNIVTWKNGEDEYIEFYQYAAVVATNINTENLSLNETSIDTTTLYYYSQDNMTSYFWYNNGYYFVLNIPEYFTIEEVENIIKSIK